MAKGKGRSKNGTKPGSSKPARPETRQLMAERMLELQSKGVPVEDIAKAHSRTPDSVRKIVNWGVKHGAADAVRDRMHAQLDKIPNIYAAILALDAKDVTLSEMNLKVRKLQLAAAQQLADGLGVFKQEKQTTSLSASMDLDEFYKLRAARAAGTLPPSDIPGPKTLPAQTVDEGEFTEEDSDGIKSIT